MQKHKENLFAEKFRLLSSQEHTENIHWSSSDSSECENVSHSDKSCNLPNKVRVSRKRKKKVPKNISNLDITILDSPKCSKELTENKKVRKTSQKHEYNELQKSPVFAPNPVHFPPYKCIKSMQTSPILTSKANTQQNNRNIPEKSPILLMKYSSPKFSPKVRKKLFKKNEENRNMNQNNVKMEPLDDVTENAGNETLDRRKPVKNYNFNIVKEEYTSFTSKTNIALTQSSKKDEIIPNDTRQESPKNIDEEIIPKTEIKMESSEENEIKQERLSLNLLQLEQDDSFAMLKPQNEELARQVKSYFENQFSSDTVSQFSITNTLTPNRNSSKSSEDVEIVSIITQINSNRTSSVSEQEIASKNPSIQSSQSAEFNMEKSKKIRYKKDGLSYRLNSLLKKQTANVSLWQHERFLAANSNFIIPKGEHLVFRIQKVFYKYGIYLLETVNVDNFKFLIVINSIYVQNDNFCDNAVLKVYEPYKIVDFNEGTKLIINVCKFECIDLID